MPTSSTAEHSAGELDSHHPQPPLTVVKRKRTKRPRHHPPAPSSSASSCESTTTEEEDMAHCLILLAQGAASSPGAAAVDSKPKSERYTSRKYTEAVATEDGVKAGFYVYECKTCNKCFPTFQALGGHRASHKKPRVAAADDVVKQQQQQEPPMMATLSPPPPPPVPQTTTIAVAVFPDVTTALSLNTIAPTATTTNIKLRVHECSICGAEFASGQALGGHMRRHRPLNAPERAVTTAIAAAATADAIKQKEAAGINLDLDLNLPAPSDEEALSPPAVVLGLGQFSDANKAGGLMLTASPLVDCHY